MPENQLVSIIMNCYNGEKYLREAIRSVITQTYQNWEIIFWDNQSTDSSSEIIKSYNDGRIKYFLAPKHTNLSEARNYAIQKTSGEFYAFLDVDDWWAPEKLEKQIPLFNDSEVGLVYGNYWYENEQTNTRKILYKNILPYGLILNELLKCYVVGLLTIVIRRKSFESLNQQFNSQYHFIGDFDCVIRMAAYWKVSCVQEPVAHYRWSGENDSNNNTEKIIQELELWYSEMKQQPTISEEINFKNGLLNRIYYMKAKIKIENKEYKDAFNLSNKLPMGIMKLKLLLLCMLPNRFLRYIIQ